MFEADTSKIKKGTEEGKKAADEMTNSLNKTDKSAQNLGKSFLNAAKSAAKLVTAVGGLAVLKTITTDTANHTFAVAQQARAMGVSVEVLSTWQRAVMSSGGTAEAAAASMETLRNKFVEMSRFGVMIGQDAFMFKQLGLSAEDMKNSIKDPTIALGKLAQTFGTLSNTQQLYIGKKLGLDNTTIMLLSRGKVAFDEMIQKQKELGIVTERQAEAATKFKFAQASLRLTLETVKREITSGILPALTWFYEKVERVIQFFREHETFAKAFFGGIAVILGVVLLPALIACAAATWALIAPFVAIAAPIIAVGAAFALVADDIDNFLKGNKSMIGELSKAYPELGKKVRQFVADMKTEFKNLGLLGEYVGDVFKVGFEKAAANYKKAGDKLAAERKAAYAKIDAVALPNSGLAKGQTTVSAVPTDIQAAALASEKKYGVPAAVSLAQYQLESGGGLHMPTGSNNPFGIKARAGQAYVEAMTTEHINGKDVRVMQKFAKFASIAEAFDAHAKLLSTGAAYSDARKNTGDAKAYARALTGHYATDPLYGDKLIAVMEKQQGAIIKGQQAAIAEQVKVAQSVIAQTNNPLAAQTSNSIANGVSRLSSNTVNVGDVNIHTQATDSAGVAGAITEHLQSQMRNMVDQHDDGLAL